MNNNEEIKKYIITIDGVDFSGKTTLWKKTLKQDNIQIRGILSNIAYGIKYGRDIDKMIEEYNKLPLNYVIYFLNPNRKTLIRNFNSRLLELHYDSEKLSKEAKSFADTINDEKYFDKAYEILKEKYKGEIILIEKRDNDIEDFKEAVDKFESYSFELFSNNMAPYIIILHTTVDEFEAQAKKASEFTKIVFIDKISEDEIIDNLYDEVDEDYKLMIDFLLNKVGRSKKEIYEEFINHSGEIQLDEFRDFLDNYEATVSARVTCDIDTNISVEVSLSKLSACESVVDYLYDMESNFVIEELKWSLEQTEFNFDLVEVD